MLILYLYILGGYAVTQSNQPLYLYIGSYAEAEDAGVYVYEFDEAVGSMKRIQEVSGLRNPTFLNVHPQADKLYAITEAVNEAGKKVGAAVAFSIDKATGKLAELNREVNVDNTLCHIQRDDAFPYVIVSSYHGGKVGLIRLHEEGTVGALVDEQQHLASETRHADAVPHVHSAFFSPDNRYLLVNDLGLDMIRTYKLDVEAGKLTATQDTYTVQGAGPRHLVFHPEGTFVFVIHELNSTIVSYRYDAENGSLTEVQSVSTLPEGYSGGNSTAEIAISKDGRFLYGSNRGHDSIVVIEINQENGQLNIVDYVSVEGKHPRHFALTPSGEYLIAANRDTDNLTVFRVDQATGRITFTGVAETISKPVCVKPVYL